MRHKNRIIMLVVVVVLAGVLILTWSRHMRLYTVTVLPKVGTQVVVPCSINDRGQIVGVCQGWFYLWERGKDWRELGQASGGGLHINNAGQIAGTVEEPNGGAQAFLWDPNERLTMLGTLGTGMSTSRALNNRGQIVGLCWKIPGAGRVFLWDKAQGMRAVRGVDGHAVMMNDAGQILACRGERAPLQPVLWEPAEDGSMTETVLPSGALCDVNNHGCVLGSAFNFDKRKYYAFLWRQDRDVEWLFPLESQMARVAVLNDANQVAVSEEVHFGWLERLTGRHLGPYKESFLWTRERGRVFLDGYVLNQQGEYLRITDLNNEGCIIGAIDWKDGGTRRAVLLEPIPQRWRR